MIYLCSPKKEVLLFTADVMKLVDMLDLGSSASRRVGSSPPIRTNIEWYKNERLIPFFIYIVSK